MKEAIAKPCEFGRAGCPKPAAAAWGHAALPGFAITSKIKKEKNSER